MLKKLKLSLLILCLPFAALAANFEAGNQYTVIDVEKSKTPNVTEFFSFYCPHCFKFEPVAKGIAENLPKGAEFVKNHVNFLGGSLRLPRAEINCLNASESVFITLNRL